MDYDVRSAKASLMLTEQGFNSTGGVKVQGAPAAAPAGAPATAPEKKEGQEKKEEKAHEKGKEDIFHILRGVEAEEKKQEAHHHAHHAEKHEAQKPESPQDAKKHEKSRRLFSKVQYYIMEYWAWALLILAAAVIFSIAIYSMMTKTKII